SEELSHFNIFNGGANITMEALSRGRIVLLQLRRDILHSAALSKTRLITRIQSRLKYLVNQYRSFNVGKLPPTILDGCVVSLLNHLLQIFLMLLTKSFQKPRIVLYNAREVFNDTPRKPSHLNQFISKA